MEVLGDHRLQVVQQPGGVRGRRHGVPNCGQDSRTYPTVAFPRPDGEIAVWLIWLTLYGYAVKTTLNLDDALMEAVRARARRMGVTLTALISDALRRTLAEPVPPEFQLSLPVTQGRRVPNVDLDSNAAVEEYLDRVEQRRPVS